MLSWIVMVGMELQKTRKRNAPATVLMKYLCLIFTLVKIMLFIKRSCRKFLGPVLAARAEFQIRQLAAASRKLDGPQFATTQYLKDPEVRKKY